MVHFVRFPLAVISSVGCGDDGVCVSRSLCAARLWCGEEAEDDDDEPIEV